MVARITVEQFEALYRPLHPGLLRFAASRVGPDRADDAVAHARLRGIQALTSYDHRHPKAFQAWMYLRLRSVCEGLRRHDAYVQAEAQYQAREMAQEASRSVDVYVVERLDHADQLRRVAAVADAVYMTTEQRQAMIGMLRGEPVDVTAERLGVTEASARRRQNEAIAIVRAAFLGEELR